MRTVWVYDDDIPKGEFARELVENGHLPGVLGLSKFKGKTKKYSQWCAQKRDETIAVMTHYYGVCDGKVLINSRWCRVWTDEWENPVKITIGGKE